MQAALDAPALRSVVRTAPGVLTEAECAALRRHCDREVATSLARDNVDGLPDFQARTPSPHSAPVL